MTRWAAKRIYPSNPERAARRSEDWEALISESIPTNISRLCFGLGMGCAGLWCYIMGYVPSAPAVVRRMPARCFYAVGKGLHWLLFGVVVLRWPDTRVIQWLEGIGSMVALLAGWYLLVAGGVMVRYGAARWLLHRTRPRTADASLWDTWLRVVVSGIPEGLE